MAQHPAPPSHPAAHGESTERREQSTAETSKRTDEKERHPAAVTERADVAERPAEQSERADMEERDAAPQPQILCMTLTSVSDEDNPDGVDPGLCCAVINLPLSCDGANIAARQQLQLVSARDQAELQLRGVAALISEYRMTQEDAEAAWGTQTWVGPAPPADEPPVDRRAATRA